MSTPRLTGTARQRRNRAILAASSICYICGHDGADEVDHVVPLARDGAEHVSNLRPAHGQAPCTACGIKCNRVKGTREYAPVIRRSGSLTRGERPPPPS